MKPGLQGAQSCLLQSLKSGATLACACIAVVALPATANQTGWGGEPSAIANIETPQPSSATSILLIRADRQGYDQQLGRFVAFGNVEARFNGWRLFADRLELAEASRSFYATGQVRLSKGDQYLQASRLRYSDWEGSGEIDDVYGVLEQDTLSSDVRNPDGADEASESAAPSFACPPLSADPEAKNVIRVIPPGRTSLPTMPAPPGCAGSDLAKPPISLDQALQAVAFGPPKTRPPQEALSSTAAESADILASPPNTPSPPALDQRVRNVVLQQSWSASLKIDLAAVIDTADSLNSNGQVYRPPSFKKGTLSRIRFQGSRIRIQHNRWTAETIAFTNDPFTPAASWTTARKVVAVMDERGVTRITSQGTRILLDGKVSLPAIKSRVIGAEEISLRVDTDKDDRDGLYLGYTLKPIRLGQGGSLSLQPQVNVQRAFAGQTSSYILPGQSLGSPPSEQAARFGDMFGLLAVLNLPTGPASLNSVVSLSTLNPDNIPDGTRSITSFSTPLNLPGHESASASLFGSYRERIYNGSLGLQTVIYSYGANLAGNTIFNQPNNNQQSQKKIPYFAPIYLNWAAQSGNYQATLFQTNTLDTLWRSYANLAVSTTLQLWQGSSLNTKSDDPKHGLRYSASQVNPGLGINFGANAYATSYSDGSSQNTLTLWGGPSITLGAFDKPVFDYTRLSASIAGTFLNGGSPFGFDRTVDLRTVSFQATQQIYGPLVVEAGATINIEDGSPFYGDVSYSYVEVKLQRRSYELGVYYSPYDGIGGIRVKLNDFNFDGTGTPFVPRPRNR